jgi:hypothetical protein
MDTAKPFPTPEISEGSKTPLESNEVLTRNEIRGTTNEIRGTAEDSPLTSPAPRESPQVPPAGNEVLTPNATLGVSEQTSSALERLENRFLYIVLAAVTAFILLGLGWYAATVSSTYGEAIRTLREPDATLATWDRFLLMLTFARAQDFGLVKGGALLLSFVVVILGMLIVVRGTQVTYRLKLAHGSAKSALETSSPGLVMVTLGLALALGIVMTQSTIGLSPGVSNMTGAQTQGVARAEDYQEFKGKELPKPPRAQTEAEQKKEETQ